MASENHDDRGFVATEPFDSSDPPRFSQFMETAKDVFLSELTSFFSYKTFDASDKLSEVPNIQKFALGATSNERSLETVVNAIVSYADTPDKFPMIAITSANVRERKMGIGSNIVAMVQQPPAITGAVSGPFNLDHGSDDPWTLEFTTWPGRTEASEVTSTITFQRTLFSDPTNITAVDLADTINKTQALYYRCSATSGGNLFIETGGPAGGKETPNVITVTGGSVEALLALGFTVGDTASYADSDNPPSNRYVVAADMVINIDVVTDSLNVRMELADLVYNFFAFYMEKRRFTFLGRSYFDRDQSPPEWFHIALKNQFAWSSEVTKSRQGGEQYDQIYAIRGSIPIFIEDFVDRSITRDPLAYDPDNFSIYNDGDSDDRAYDSVVPSGDYEIGIDYRS